MSIDTRCPAVMIVLDRTGSMGTIIDAMTLTRWDYARSAIDQVLATYEGQLPFGAITFQNLPSCYDFTAEVSMSPAIGQRTAISTAFGGMTLIGAAAGNTGQAVKRARQMLTSFQDAAPGRPPGVLLVVTDGISDCPAFSSVLGPTTEPDYTIWEIQNAFALGMKTAIAIPGTTADQTQLRAMAVAGEMPCMGSCGLREYYGATAGTTGLAAVLDGIIQQIIASTPTGACSG